MCSCTGWAQFFSLAQTTGPVEVLLLSPILQGKKKKKILKHINYLAPNYPGVRVLNQALN